MSFLYTCLPFSFQWKYKHTGRNTKLYVEAKQLPRYTLQSELSHTGRLCWKHTSSWGYKLHTLFHNSQQISNALAEIPDFSRKSSPFKSQRGYTNNIHIWKDVFSGTKFKQNEKRHTPSEVRTCNAVFPYRSYSLCTNRSMKINSTKLTL